MPTQDQATLGWAADDDNHGYGAVWIELRAGQPGSAGAASASNGSQAIINGYGSGRTELISQYYDATDNRYEFSGNQDIDGALIGSRWTPTNLTFSFPTSGSFYTDGTGSYFGNEAANHVVFNAQQQTATRYAVGLVSSYTNLTFTEVTETATTHANLRLSQTNDGNVYSAYGHFPASAANAGDIWFGRTGEPFYTTPAPGNWGQATIMHEIGHTLGLKHGHQDYTGVNLASNGDLDRPPGGGPRYGSAALPSNHDGQDWSLMTYRTDPALGGNQYGGEGVNQPQTYMQDDIAALQYLYGANFNANSGDTTYTWNPNSGQQSINGVAQVAPTANKILMTLWDGNGTDTYDLSNYTTNLSIDLNPGAFSTFSSAQLANHRAYYGETALAVGNVANALLYQNDTRSLIENANGGTGADKMLGNQADNTLRGNGGTDRLIGSIGNDTLLGGGDSDSLYGDGSPARPSGIGYGSGQITKSAEVDNGSSATALDVTNAFSLASNANIGDSTSVPHVSINAAGGGHYDFYKITVAAGTTITLDLDLSVNLNAGLTLYNPSGQQVGFNDTAATSLGGGGSTTTNDPYLRYTATVDGTYVIAVSNSSGAPYYIQSGQSYVLQVSASAIALEAAGSGAGNDILDGGTGADTMVGGLGDDTYYVDVTGDVLTENAGEGTDTVFTAIDYTLGADLENLRANAGSTGLALTGNALNNLITGGTGNDIITGGSGIDTASYAERSGSVVITLAASGDTTAYLDGIAEDTLRNIENLSGGSGSDVLTGNASTTALSGNGGDDTIALLAANNGSFNGGEGTDTIDLSLLTSAVTVNLDYTYGYHIAYPPSVTVDGGDYGVLFNFENAIGTGLNDTIAGNSANNHLEGGEGNDTLEGGAGGDLLDGGGGIDTISYEHATEGVTVDINQSFNNTGEAAGDGYIDVENILGSAFDDTLRGAAEDNVINGGGGNDTLDGGAGIDRLIGGAGNDTYYTSGDDTLVEGYNAGIDTVVSSGTYVLAYGLDNLTLTGSGNFNGSGNALNNIITGNSGNNTLAGGSGADTLIGGAGDDIYQTDQAGDLAVEAVGGGYDTVVALGSYGLSAGQEIEVIQLSSSTGSSNFNLSGNEFANTLRGNSGNNQLDGKAGADSMYGSFGNDIYVVDNAGDLVFEDVNRGTDTIVSTSSYTLSSAQHIEALQLNSSTGSTALNLTGNELAQTIRGNAGANVIDGKAGTDTLYGNAGADTFVFSTTTGSGNIDTIADFSVVDDTIHLSRSIFANLSAGALSADAFKDITSGTGGTLDASDRILYDRSNGALYYDVDGNGAGTAMQFAILSTKPATLSAADFFVIT